MSDAQFQLLAESLNKLENVKVHKETGIVRLRKEGIWHILSKKPRDNSIHNLVVDYEGVRIGHKCAWYTIFQFIQSENPRFSISNKSFFKKT